MAIARPSRAPVAFRAIGTISAAIDEVEQSVGDDLVTVSGRMLVAERGG